MTKKYMGIREIAKLAGVSVATVSRVINGADNISDATRNRVNEVIREHNYVPNIAAKGLYSDSSKSIALFILDLDNPFFVSLVKNLNKTAFENGYTLLICNTESNPKKELEYLKYCDGIRTKGIIITEGPSKTIFKGSTHQTIVFHDRIFSDEYSYVKCNNAHGMQLAVDHLYNLNHKKIAFAGYIPNVQSSMERRNAFLMNMQEKELLVPDDYIFEGSFTAQKGMEAFDYFCSLKNRPSAIVCANDMIARGFISRALSLGMSVPEDFSIIGFDGCSSDYFYPQITTIKQDVEMIAQKLFECAVSDSSEIHQFEVDVSLSVGSSCKKLID